MSEPQQKYPTLEGLRPGEFHTATGRIIDVLNPQVDQIDVEDIAWGLSNFCRFGGQMRTNYNVGQHSVLVACMAPAKLKPVALHHDSPEAYIGDVIKPLKIMLGGIYAELEERWTCKIFEAFFLDPSLIELVKPYDLELLEIEHAFIHGQSNELLKLTKHQFGQHDPGLWNHFEAYNKFRKLHNTYFLK